MPDLYLKFLHFHLHLEARVFFFSCSCVPSHAHILSVFLSPSLSRCLLFSVFSDQLDRLYPFRRRYPRKKGVKEENSRAAAVRAIICVPECPIFAVVLCPLLLLP